MCLIDQENTSSVVYICIKKICFYKNKFVFSTIDSESFYAKYLSRDNNIRLREF